MLEGYKVAITCVHRDTKVYPMAEVELQWDGKLEKLVVGVIPNLVEDLILRVDYPHFQQLLPRQVPKSECEEGI